MKRTRARALVVASHAAPTAAVTIFATTLAFALHATTPTVLLVAVSVLTGQLSVGWSNDWLDAARDIAVARTDKPVVTGIITATTLRHAAITALALCAVTSLATGWVPGLVHLAAVAGAWAYNATLKATAWSWAPYAFSFGLLAVYVILAAGETPAPWVVLAAALLGTGAHIANTLPDLDDDAATGIRGLPHRLGRRRACVLAPLVLAAATTTVVLGPPGPPTAVALLAGAAAVALAVVAGARGATGPTSRAPFALSMAVAGICVVLLVLAAPAVSISP